MVSGPSVRRGSPTQVRPVAAGLLLAGVALVCMAVYADRAVQPAAAILLLMTAVVVGYRFLARWEVMIALVVLVVMFIPIKRYQFAASLPFDLEPYRIAIALVVGLWLAALLVDSRMTLRRTVLDGPLLLFGLAVVASVALNPDTITGTSINQTLDVSGNVAKELLFLLSFYLVYYFIASVVRTPETINTVLKTLVLGATVVAFFAIIEERTRYNVFDHLQGIIPALRFEGILAATRGGRLRVYGSAQHPIALAAMLVSLAPVSLYIAYQTGRRRWYISTVLLTLAAMATVSRTGITMLAATFVVFLVLRRALVKSLLIAALPLLIAVHIAVPGAIGGIRQAFFPSEGLVQDQTVYGGRLSSRRLGPQFDVIRAKPAFGQGYGTRITSGPDTNALILDDQWLGTAVETGLVGLAAWLWLFARFARRAGSAARRDPTGRGFLLTALTASSVAFAVGMLTYDAFSFIQATVVLFMLLALGSSALAWKAPWPDRGLG